jgi:nitric oxide reductase NorE protein
MSKIMRLKEKYPPGDFGIWFIIYVELITFGLFLLAMLFQEEQILRCLMRHS